MAASPLVRQFVIALGGTLLLVGCKSGDGSPTLRTDSASAATAADSMPLDTATTGACTTEATGPSEFAYTTIAGVEPDLTSLDLYLPAGCEPVPVVVWVHGGGWRRGDKVGSLGNKVEMVNDLGAALVSVNYRLSTPGATSDATPDDRVQWPDHGNDVAAAIAWVQSEGPQHGLDPTRITLMGHSAGGHLVSIVVADPSLLAGAGISPDSVQCVIALDSAAFDLANSPAEESGLVPNAFGTDPAVIAAASPLTQVLEQGPPAARFLVVTRGSALRVRGAQAFVDALNNETSETNSILVEVNPYSHMDVNDRLGEPGEQLVTQPVTEFLQICLAG